MTSASKQVSRDAFCLYIGQHAEVLDPVAPVALGAEGLERAVEGGLGEAAVGPGEQVGAERVDVFVLMGEAGLAAPGRTRRSRWSGCAASPGRARTVSTEPSAAWVRRSSSTAALAAGSRPGRRSTGEAAGAGAPAKAGWATQWTRFSQSCSWSSSSMQSSPNRSESAVTTTRPAPCSAIAASGAPGIEAVGCARAITRAPLRGVQGAGAVEAGAARRRRAGRRRTLRAVAVRARRAPRRGRRRGGARSPGRVALSICEVEAAEELVQVGAVLVLLGLAEDDQAAAVADEGLDRVDLGRVEERRAAVDGRLPLRVGRVGDDQHRGAGERVGVERAVGVGGDVERARGEQLRGAGERRVAGMGGLHLGRDLGADGPGLGVGLVEEDAGELAGAGGRFHRDQTVGTGG